MIPTVSQYSRRCAEFWTTWSFLIFPTLGNSTPKNSIICAGLSNPSLAIGCKYLASKLSLFPSCTSLAFNTIPIVGTQVPISFNFCIFVVSSI